MGFFAPAQTGTAFVLCLALPRGRLRVEPINRTRSLRERPDLSVIQPLEESLHRPDIRRDRQALEQLLAEGFVEFGASGTRFDRTTIIKLLLNEADDGGELRAFDYDLTPISDDAALLTYATERTAQGGSKRQVLRSSLWVRDGDSWRMLFHQGTVRS